MKQINSAQFAVAQGSAIIGIYDVNTYQLVTTLTGHSYGVIYLDVLSNGLLASGSYDNKVKIWNTTTRQVVQGFNPFSESVYRFRQLSDGSLLICGDSNVVLRYNLNIGGTAQEITRWSTMNANYHCADILVSGQNALIGVDQVVKVVNSSNNVYYMSFNGLDDGDQIYSIEKIESIN